MNDIILKRLLTGLGDGSIRKTMSKGATVLNKAIDRKKTMVMEQVQNVKDYKILLHQLHNVAPEIAWSDFPASSPGTSPIEVCHIIGEWYVHHSNVARRHDAGQFFTPPIVARYMANVAGTGSVSIAKG